MVLGTIKHGALAPFLNWIMHKQAFSLLSIMSVLIVSLQDVMCLIKVTYSDLMTNLVLSMVFKK